MKKVVFVRGNEILEKPSQKKYTFLSHKLTLFSFFLLLLLTTGGGSAFLLKDTFFPQHAIPSSPTGLTESVLGATTGQPNTTTKIQFSIPAEFDDTVTATKDVIVDGSLTIAGKTLTTGDIQAPNVLYGVKAGSGISLGSGQTPTISNTGVTSLQGQTGALNFTAGSNISINGLTISANAPAASNSFATISSDGTNFSAESSTDTLTITAGTGVTINTDTTNKALTINATGGLSGLTANGILYASDGTTAVSLTPGTSGYILQSNGANAAPSWVVNSGSNPAFSNITSGTNTSATMTVGNGATLTYTGSGILNANELLGASWASPNAIGGTTANTGTFTTLVGTTINGLTLSNNGDGFSLAGGTTSRTLTVTGSNITLTGGGNTLTLTGNASLDQNLLTTSLPTFAGLTVNGNVTLGQTTANTITPNGLFNASLLPASTSINLGSASHYFGTVYAQNILTNATSGQNGFWQLNTGALSPTYTTNDLLIGGSATNSALFQISGVNGNATTTGTLTFTEAGSQIQTTNDHILTLGGDTTGDIQLKPGDSPGLYLAANGNVGVGTTDPKQLLDIGGNVWVTSGGNVGIGNSVAPIAALQLGSNFSVGGANPKTLFLSDFSNGTNGSGQITGNWRNIATGWAIGTGNFINNDQTLRIGTTSDGVGTWTTANGDLKLLINGALGAQATADLDVRSFGNTIPVASFSGKTSFASLVVDNSGSGDLFTASSSGLTRFTISQIGHVGIDGNANANTMLNITNPLTGQDSIQVNGTTVLTQNNFFNANGYYYGSNHNYFIDYQNAINSLDGYIKLNNTGNPLAVFDLRSNPAFDNASIGFGTIPIASLSGNTSAAGLVVDNAGRGDIFTASNSGASKFVIANNGNVGIGTTTPTALLSINANNFTDTFNRVDAASLGSNWTKVTDAGTDFQIVSNQLKETSSDNSTAALGAYTSQGITNADYSVQADITFPSTSNNWIAVGGRESTNGTSDMNGYFAFAAIQNQKVAIYKRSGGTYTQLSTAPSVAINSGTTYTIKLVMQGTTLSLYWNGVLETNVTDTTFSSAGFAGIAVGNPNLANNIWDNFSVTPITPDLNVNNNMVVNSNGWIGLGTTTPSYAIDVQNGSINDTGNLYISGNTGLNTSTPQFRLDVVDTQASTGSARIENLSTGAKPVGLDLQLGYTTTTGNTANHFVDFMDGGGNVRGTIEANNTGVAFQTNGIADFAEYLKKNPTEKIVWGEILCLGSDGNVHPCDQTHTNIAGVASENPSFVGGVNLGDGSITVGLSGQVETFVSTQNGIINPGDPVTLSSQAGVGVKATTAGGIVGRAIDGFDETGTTLPCPSGSGICGKILVLVSPTYSDPTVQLAQDGNLNTPMPSSIVPTTNATVLATSTIPSLPSRETTSPNNLTTMQEAIASLSAQVGKITDISHELNDVEKQMDTTLSLTATSSSVLATTDATVDGTLNVLGRTVLTDLGVTGVIDTGLLSINGLDTRTGSASATINTIGSPLRIQSLAGAGVDFENGTVTIDTNGNMTINTLFVKKLELAGRGNDATVGNATIPAGQTEVVVKTTAVTQNSHIFTSPLQTLTLPLSILAKQSNTSFTVGIAQPQTKDILFSWFLVDGK